MLRGAAILSSGTLVRGIIIDPRGVEVPDNVPVLDSHNIANGGLGHVEHVWATDDTLFGELIFTGRAGRRAYDLIERGSLSGVSCGFDIVNIAIREADGSKVYIEDAIERGPDDPDLIVIAQRTILKEVSITAMPADRNACVRACSVEGIAWQVIHDG